ncbi:ligase [Thermosipho sp. 1063]|uniref:lipoate--protein ligase family protein n=1 Tax=unclassified Thermosipho (in: thermotogales) TaxID=2676525 RepID=UPI0009492AFC|nr:MULTISPECIES: lipoate--protein ligase family protein [unclassified Thermosipho (in: thermotogales)]ANQ53390.1 ligase [Thermosipho sp. 1070]APT71839.1 ligase [Thermosipho sp. 1063]OOC44976.1 ligase [Thermosipho sp. 1074]
MYYIETWKLSGDLNMAVDYVLGKSNAPFFRLYTWKEPTLSLGKNQSVEDVDFDFLRENNIKCVRRPTGGRAVLHKYELTYSIVIPNGHELYRLSIISLYKAISQLIVDVLNKLDVPVRLVSRGIRGNTNVCFDAPSWYEIVLDNKKVVGSAQMRTRSFVLQHGSIVLKTIDNVDRCFKNTNQKIVQYGIDQSKNIEINRLRELLYEKFDEKFGLIKFQDVDKILKSAERERKKFCCI